MSLRVCSCLNAVSLAISVLVSMIYGVYTTVIYCNIHHDFLFISVDIGTYMRLDLLVGSAKGCLSSTCTSLCGWKGVNSKQGINNGSLSFIQTWQQLSINLGPWPRGTVANASLTFRVL